MTAKILRFHDDARERVCGGLDTRANAVEVTLGKTTLAELGRTARVEIDKDDTTLIGSARAARSTIGIRRRLGSKPG